METSSKFSSEAYKVFTEVHHLCRHVMRLCFKTLWLDLLEYLFCVVGNKHAFSCRLQDALDEQKKVKVMTVTQTLVDGKVVSSSTETKERKL